ncbi:hypothetical protein PENTCL1PPCAC_25994, partial [Pristionchus entomophagus]
RSRMAVPDSYFGSWTSDGHEKFDEYLAQKDIPWLIRKAILIAGHSVTIANLGNGRYRAEHAMMSRSAKYEFSLNEEFEITGMDGIQHKITVTMEGSSLVEWHTLLDKPNQPVDKQVYSVEGGKLVQTLGDGNLSCKRFFKKKN